MAIAELYGTVFLTGAAVMVVEILGTRIIAPVFGVNLFVWSALLAVTLCSLALGYHVGGNLVDRKPHRRVLGIVVTVAGALMALPVPARRPILSLADGLGPRVGPLLSATLLFGPCLAALGMVGPIVVRLATQDFRTTGRRVGRVYAVSTGGSLLGTLVTGFVLIPVFDTSQILLGAASSIALLGAIPLLFRKNGAALVALFVPALALLTSRPTLPSGIDVLARSQSLYGLVEVIEDKSRGARFLRVDHSVIGANWVAQHSSAFSFLHMLEALRFMRPQAKNALQIGLGTGALPVALNPYGIVSDVVEIDPEVLRLAREYFGFSTKGDVYIEDARTLLRRSTDRRYDLIIHDTFTGGTTPEHLLSIEVLRRIHAMLRPGGVLALNFVGYQRGPHVESSLAIMRTLRAAFTTVKAFREIDPNEMPDAMYNIVFFASDASVDFVVPEGATFENEICEGILRSLARREVLRQPTSGPIITDDRNPLARLQLATASDHFAFMKQMLPPEVWLN